MKKANSQQAVRQYFDKIASAYPAKYQPTHPYHHYFFQERLAAATTGLDFNGKTILDIGAGTGALYDFLSENSSQFDYYATDISAAMMSQSRVPKERCFTGPVHEMTLPVAQFDYIFVLGVTSYMSREDFLKTLFYIATQLSPSGLAVMSFTNSRSVDFRLRKGMKGMARIFTGIPAVRRSVLGQSFVIKGYSEPEVKHLLPPSLVIQELHWLNQTVTPFNHLLPGTSVRLAQWLKRVLPRKWLPTFSGDFMMTVRKSG